VSTLAKPAFLHVKLAGGATAQLLGLMNAVYASDKLGLPFKISHYPYSTGTYWPFAISHFLSDDEILNVNVSTIGLKNNQDLQVGKLILNHPLMQRKISYERFLSLIRKFKLESTLNFFRRELTVKASPKKLNKINSYYKTLSGGFASINDENVNKEMHQRYMRAGIKSPYIKEQTKKQSIVIHYRLGDRRITGKSHSDFTAVKILHAKSYKEVLDQVNNLGLFKIYVISDEPQLAQSLLAQVGINVDNRVTTGSIWDDLYFASQSDIFIGSDSQVSQLANIYVENNDGKSFMLNFIRDAKNRQFKNTRYLNSKFIDTQNEIYQINFSLEKNTHSSYLKNR
jgi:hypothetical protein